MLVLRLRPYIHFLGPALSHATCDPTWIGRKPVMGHGIIHDGGQAILKSQGRTWDGMPIPKLQVTDLKREAIDLFKEKALRRHRLTEEETRVDDTILMKKGV